MLQREGAWGRDTAQRMAGATYSRSGLEHVPGQAGTARPSSYPVVTATPWNGCRLFVQWFTQKPPPGASLERPWASPLQRSSPHPQRVAHCSHPWTPWPTFQRAEVQWPGPRDIIVVRRPLRLPESHPPTRLTPPTQPTDGASLSISLGSLVPSPSPITARPFFSSRLARQSRCPPIPGASASGGVVVISVYCRIT